MASQETKLSKEQKEGKSDKKVKSSKVGKLDKVDFKTQPGLSVSDRLRERAI